MQRAERFRQMSANFEKTGLATPFKGIDLTGNIELGRSADPIDRNVDRTRTKSRRTFLCVDLQGAAPRVRRSEWTIRVGASG